MEKSSGSLTLCEENEVVLCSVVVGESMDIVGVSGAF